MIDTYISKMLQQKLKQELTCFEDMGSDERTYFDSRILKFDESQSQFSFDCFQIGGKFTASRDT